MELGGDWIRLRATLEGDQGGSTRDHWRNVGRLGLAGLGGYAHVDAIRELDDENGEVVRSFAPMRGTLSVGTFARLETYAFPDDPAVGRGIEFDDVTHEASIGAAPAWRVDGTRDDWVIFVHGKGGTRRESLCHPCPELRVLDPLDQTP